MAGFDDQRDGDLEMKSYNRGWINGISVGIALTHVPTGLTARAKGPGSQRSNREVARRIIAAKLRRARAGGPADAPWGDPIRPDGLLPDPDALDRAIAARLGGQLS